MPDAIVIGQPLDTSIINQLKQRAKRQSNAGYRNSDDIIYMGTKNAWVKMSSFIRLIPGSDGAAKYGGDFTLAKKWVLSAEAKNDNGAFKYGVAKDTGAYGTGGIDELGYRPMPGIYSVSLESQPPLGAVRSATIKVKAWNLEQLSIIDILYFRLGCCILLEWGHSIYVKNDGTIGKDIQTVDIFNKSDICNEELIKELAQKRKQYDHNYDGMIGRIVNYNWSQSPDGSYDCEIKVVGLGTVIESLKINGQGAMPIPIDPPPAVPTADNSTDPASNQVAKPVDSNITAFLTNIENYPTDATFYENVNTKCFTGLKLLANKDTNKAFKYGYSKAYMSLPPGTVFSTADIPPVDFSKLVGKFKTSVVKIVDGQPQNPVPNTFIPLGLLFAYINNSCMLYSSGCGSKKPILYIDFNPETNLCMRIPNQFSVDPGICLVDTDCSQASYDNLFLYKKVNPVDIVSPTSATPAGSSIMASIKPLASYIKSQDTGRIMNILVNTECIRAVVEECTDSDKNVMLSMFISTLMTKIQAALGNINSFTINYSEDANVITITDAQIVGGAALPKDIPAIPVFGLRSLAREFSLVTEIGSNLGSMLAITARAGARSTGTNQDVSSFTRLNNSIEDRLYPKISDDPNEEANTPPPVTIPFAAPAAAPAAAASFGSVITGQTAIAAANANVAAAAAATKALEDLKGVTQLGNTFNAQIAACYRLGEDANVIKYDQSAVSSINQFYIDAMLIAKNGGITADNKPSSVTATGVLPIAANITVDGIGGIPLLQSFAIPPDRLPESYKDEKGNLRVAFTVVGLNHTIEGNQWTTRIVGKMFNIPGGYSVVTEGFKGEPRVPPAEVTGVGKSPSQLTGGEGKIALVPDTSSIPDSAIDTIPGTYTANGGSKVSLAAVGDKPIGLGIVKQFLVMQAAAKKDGINLSINSGFRSPEDPINARSTKGITVSASSQRSLWNANPNPSLVARPGSSNHGNAFALDLNTGSKTVSGKGAFQKNIYQWLIDNAYKYGFVRAVPKEEWHWEYRPGTKQYHSKVPKTNIAYNGMRLDPIA